MASPLPLQLEAEAELTQLVFLIALFFLTSYAAGHFLNRRRLRKLKVLFEAVLSNLDRDHRTRVVGSRNIVFSGRGLGETIAQYSMAVFILGQESILNWAIARLAGRRDMAILRASLRHGTKLEFDVMRKDGPAYRHWDRKTGGTREIFEEGDLVLLMGAKSGAHDFEGVRRVVRILREVGEVWSLSVRNQAPEVVASFSVKGVTSNRLALILSRIVKALDSLK